MFWAHGLGKWGRLVSGNEIRFGDPIGLGPELSFYLIVFAEAICSLFVVVGLYTRAATIPLIIGMGVVFFMVHFSDPINGIEKPFLYMMIFIVIYILGPGKHSLDFKFFEKSN
jgi:putative oxidoreductase